MKNKKNTCTFRPLSSYPISSIKYEYPKMKNPIAFYRARGLVVNGCRASHTWDARLWESCWRQWFNISFTCGECVERTPSGGRGDSSRGASPYVMLYKIAPADHISALDDICAPVTKHSGALKKGVPIPLAFGSFLYRKVTARTNNNREEIIPSDYFLGNA